MVKPRETNSERFIDHRGADKVRSTLKVFSFTVLNKDEGVNPMIVDLETECA